MVSSTRTDPPWQNTTVLTGDRATAMAELNDTDGGDFLANGSLRLVETRPARTVTRWRAGPDLRAQATRWARLDS